jgi:Tfp pilus assembly protein PilN
MNMQMRMTDQRAFRIALIAVAAAAVLVIAAYLFGTGLRADTSASADRAASLAALEKSSADFHADQSDSVMATGRAAALAALEKSSADFHADQSNSARAAAANIAPAAIQSWVSGGSAAAQYQWIKPEGIEASGGSAGAQFPSIKPEGVKVSGAK